MNYYRYEKSQLKSPGAWICTAAFLFCFLLNVGASTEAASDTRCSFPMNRESAYF